MRSALEITITQVVQDFVDGVETEAVDFLRTVCHRESSLVQLERAVRVYCSLRFRMRTKLVEISILETQLFSKWEYDFAAKETVVITIQDEILRLLCEYSDGKESAFTEYLDHCIPEKLKSPALMIRKAELFCMLHYGIEAPKRVVAVSNVESVQYKTWLLKWQMMSQVPPDTEPQLPSQESSSTSSKAKTRAIDALNVLNSDELGEVLDMFLFSNDGESQEDTGSCAGYSIPNFQQIPLPKSFFDPYKFPYTTLPKLPKAVFSTNFDPPPWAYVPSPFEPQFEYDPAQGWDVPVPNKIVVQGADGRSYEFNGTEFECNSDGTFKKVTPQPESTSYQSGMDASKDSLPSSTAPKKKYAFKIEDEVYYEGSLFKTKRKARIIDLSKDKPKATILVEGDKCGYVVNLSTLTPVSESST